MTIIRKTFRIARGTALALGIAVILAVVLGVATAALAAVPGDPFRLGKVNVINALTQLVGEKTGPMLRIDNNGTGYALQLLVEPNRPPLTVNADAGKAVNLNADELDGKDSSRFATGVNGKATNADKLDGIDSTGFYRSGSKVANSDRLDGKDSTAFANGVNGKATNADKLDGIDSSGFYRSGSKVADSDKLDGKDSGEFVQNTGEMTFSVFGPWVSGDPSVTVDQGFNTTRFTKGAGGQMQTYLQLNPSLPSSLYGKSMLLTGVELCYNTSNEGVALGEINLLRYSSTEPGSSGGNFVVRASSPTDGALCHKYSGTPLLMGTNSFAVLQLRVDWSAQTTFYIQRTTFFLEPSDTSAAPL